MFVEKKIVYMFKWMPMDTYRQTQTPKNDLFVINRYINSKSHILSQILFCYYLFTTKQIPRM